MALLNGGIANIFGAALSGLYLPATLHKPGEYATDGDGNVLPAVPTDVACRAQVDAATYTMRQSEGYSEGDMRIIVLAAGLGGPVTTDDQISVAGQRWMIGSAEMDAAASHWVCRGRKAG